jgi:omega-hydroxy-beta-dihydromenaquinone-9 sulfotransferase
LVRNRFAVDRGYRAVAARNTLGCAVTSVLGLVQRYWYGNRIARTPLSEPPLFILGHWHSGTTLLHDLLGLDPRHTFANTYACWMPRHFLLSELLFKRWLPIPSADDEWALALLGQPSPYLTSAFPNRPPAHADYLDLEGVPQRQREAWKLALRRFVQALVYKRPGRPVLQSALHMARIKVLLEVFPDACFVHIVRNPYQAIPPTLQTFRLIHAAQGLQRPTGAGLQDLVFSTYERLFRRLEEGRKLVDPLRFHELRYEDLVEDPAACLATLYEHLRLGGFEELKRRLAGYLATSRSDETGDPPLELQAKIATHCDAVIRRYQYQRP